MPESVVRSAASRPLWIVNRPKVSGHHKWGSVFHQIPISETEIVPLWEKCFCCRCLLNGHYCSCWSQDWQRESWKCISCLGPTDFGFLCWIPRGRQSLQYKQKRLKFETFRPNLNVISFRKILCGFCQVKKRRRKNKDGCAWELCSCNYFWSDQKKVKLYLHNRLFLCLPSRNDWSTKTFPLKTRAPPLVW